MTRNYNTAVYIFSGVELDFLITILIVMIKEI